VRFVKTLYSLIVAGALAVGCNHKAPPVVPTSPVVEEKKSEQKSYKPVRNDVIGPLKEYVYAQYDIALHDRRDDLPEIEKKMVAALNAAGMSDTTIQQIKDSKDAKQLEDFFAEQGLTFRNMVTIGSRGYELFKIDSIEKKEMTLFGTVQKYTKTRITEKSLIDNSFTYEAEKRNLKISGVTGLHVRGTDRIEYRVYQDEDLADRYFEGVTKQGDALEAESKNPELLEKLLGSGKKINEKLCDRLGTVLHYMGVRDIYRQSKDKNEFRQKVLPIWEREIEIHEVTHCMDSFEFDKALMNKLSKENRLLLNIETVVHMEARSLVSELCHDNEFAKPYPDYEYKILGDLFKSLAGDEPGKVNEHQKAAKLILSGLLNHIYTNKDEYPELNITQADPQDGTNLGAVCSRFVLLKPAQIRKLSRTLFDQLYEGKTLKELMHRRGNGLK